MINLKSVAVVSGLILGSVAFTSCENAPKKEEAKEVAKEVVVEETVEVVADSTAVVVDSTVVVKEEVIEAPKTTEETK